MTEPLLERVVDDAEAGGRLDQVLAGWLEEPRSRAQRRIADGRVRVDGAPAVKSARLAAGARVEVERDPVEPPPAPPAVPVRWEDEHLLVVAKPAGLVVHRGAGTRAPTLVDALVAMGRTLAPSEDPHRPGIVHRLDRDTTGVLVVAKTAAARAGLMATFRNHDAERRYWALTEGVPHPASATVDAPIARSLSNRTTFAVDPAGRPAVTHYDVHADLGAAAEVEVRLETGRTHQVRVHLSSIGHPLVGDLAYGAGRRLAALAGLRRPALHARSLAFDHPVTRERVEVAEPLPEDLVQARRTLAAHTPGRG